MSTLRPIGSNVIIKRDASEETTPGGLVIPDKAKEKPGRGTVIAVGGGKTLDNGQRVAPTVKPGDSVLFSKWASEHEIGGEKHVIVKEDEILAVIGGEPTEDHAKEPIGFGAQTTETTGPEMAPAPTWGGK